MKIYKIPYAKIAIIIISFVFAFAACTKVDTPNSSTVQNTTSSTGKTQNAFRTAMFKQFSEQTSSTSGKFGLPLVEGFVDRTDDILTGGDTDPHPIDCVMEAFVMNHNITASVNCDYEINLFIENHFGGTNTLTVWINGFPFTATLMGEDPNNHCRSFYKVEHISPGLVGVNPLTGGNLNITYQDPGYGTMNTEVVWVQFSACDGTYQPTASAGATAGTITYYVPIPICYTFPMPDHYEFKFIDVTPGSGGATTTILLADPAYRTASTSGGFTSGHTYELWGRGVCSGVYTDPFPGQPATVVPN